MCPFADMIWDGNLRSREIFLGFTSIPPNLLGTEGPKWEVPWDSSGMSTVLRPQVLKGSRGGQHMHRSGEAAKVQVTNNS